MLHGGRVLPILLGHACFSLFPACLLMIMRCRFREKNLIWVDSLRVLAV